MLRTTVLNSLVFLGFLISEPWLSGAEPGTPAAGQQILILRNGQTLEGRITQKDGGYAVDLSDGQIRVKAADVDLVCNSLEDGYRRKRSEIQVGNVYHHLELVQWCLRHELWGPAAVELADAKVADPTHPMIPVLEHRLAMAQEPSSPPSSAGHKVEAGPSNEELDRMIRGLPKGTVEMFTQSVQPVLMNNCAAGGCHGAQSESGLRLFRVPTGKQASRRITQRNLYAVLSFIDRENPGGSRLLTAPNAPHGTAKYAIFDEHQAAQYKRLIDWVGQLGPQATTDGSEMFTAGSPMEPARPSSVDMMPQVLSQEARRTHSSATSVPRAPAKHATTHPTAKAAPEAKPAAGDQTADPFDPEVFNRRYTAEKKQPAAAPQ
jgi:hypothetical protein